MNLNYNNRKPKNNIVSAQVSINKNKIVKNQKQKNNNCQTKNHILRKYNPNFDIKEIIPTDLISSDLDNVLKNVIQNHCILSYHKYQEFL